MINELLLHGSLNVVSMADLSKMTGLSLRQVRKAAERERLQGIPILADENGYYLPEENAFIGKMEMMSWISKRTAAAATILKTVESIKKKNVYHDDGNYSSLFANENESAESGGEEIPDFLHNPIEPKAEKNLREQLLNVQRTTERDYYPN